MSNVQVVELPELPTLLHIVLLSKHGGYWCHSWSKQGRSVPFATSEFSLNVTGDTIKHWLRQQWLEENSDVRFAWKWSQWSDEERIALIISIRRDAKEIKQVMRWILLSSAVPIDDGAKIRWVLNWQLPAGGRLYRYYTIKHEASELLTKWQKWLWRHFFDNQRINETDENVCTPDKRKYEDIVQVEFSETPSAHERLEARLQLRDWLQDKATPKEIKHLLDE